MNLIDLIFAGACIKLAKKKSPLLIPPKGEVWVQLFKKLYLI